MERKKACVPGGTGYVGSILVKRLLEKGYAVNATVRDPANNKKVAHLLDLQVLGDLKLFMADLTQEGSLDQNDMIKPAINGMLNVLKSCVKAKTVKRVVCSSSGCAVSLNKLIGTGHVVDEESWTDVEYISSEKPPIWGCAVSKTLAEKAAWKFAEENNLDLITVVPALIASPSLTTEVSGSVHCALSFLTAIFVGGRTEKATARMERKRACVTGGTGYVGSMLVKRLLEKGYAVNATVRRPVNNEKVSHLLDLQVLGDLKLFKANLTEEGSFDDAINGCDFVFHVATPVQLESQDQENDIIKPSINGMLNVLKSCVKAKTVRRVVCTSSGSAVSLNRLTGTGHVVDEESWTDIEYLTSEKPPVWGYAVSKVLAEKAAWKFAEENNLNLITLAPVLIAGPSLTPEVPWSVRLALSLLIGNEHMINSLKRKQLISGSISLVHVEDVCRAHIFVAENESASGRYICCAVNTCVPELAKFLSERYPPYNVLTDFGDFPENPKLSISSEKLIKAGFSYNYGIEEMYDESVEYLRAVGMLSN